MQLSVTPGTLIRADDIDATSMAFVQRKKRCFYNISDCSNRVVSRGTNYGLWLPGEKVIFRDCRVCMRGCRR